MNGKINRYDAKNAKDKQTAKNNDYLPLPPPKGDISEHGRHGRTRKN